jgi:hypothetical protein
MIKKILNWFREPIPKDHYREHYMVLLKSARRCAYDLRHAADDLYFANASKTSADTASIEWYRSRANMWLSIFAPDGIKDYRLEFHKKIFELECKLKAFRKLCEDHNVELPYELDDIPL